MADGSESRWRARGRILLWTALGALVIAAFFIAAFFRDFSPLAVGDPGAIILLVPILTGFLLGVLLTDEEIVVAAGAGVLAAVLAVLFVGVFLFSPVIAGVAGATQPFAAFSVSRIALSTVVLFPLVVVGSVVGRGVGDLFLPSVRVKEEHEQLREQTRQWHDALDRLERRQSEEGGRAPVAEEPPEKGKD